MITELMVFAGGAYFALGFLHTVYTLMDLRKPKRFAPADSSVQTAMMGTTIRLTKGRTTMWDGWLGFNISHGMGVMMFGAATIGIALFNGGQLATAGMLCLLCAISAVYFLVAIRFWFYLPATGAGLGTLCLAIATVLRITA